jgi:hypothetical protein
LAAVSPLITAKMRDTLQHTRQYPAHSILPEAHWMTIFMRRFAFAESIVPDHPETAPSISLK